MSFTCGQSGGVTANGHPCRNKVTSQGMLCHYHAGAAEASSSTTDTQEEHVCCICQDGIESPEACSLVINGETYCLDATKIDEMATGKTSVALKCGHVLHLECLMTWATAKFSEAHAPSCPMCRSPIPIEAHTIFDAQPWATGASDASALLDEQAVSVLVERSPTVWGFALVTSTVSDVCFHPNYAIKILKSDGALVLGFVDLYTFCILMKFAGQTTADAVQPRLVPCPYNRLLALDVGFQCYREHALDELSFCSRTRFKQILNLTALLGQRGWGQFRVAANTHCYYMMQILRHMEQLGTAAELKTDSYYASLASRCGAGLIRGAHEHGSVLHGSNA